MILERVLHQLNDIGEIFPLDLVNCIKELEKFSSIFPIQKFYRYGRPNIRSNAIKIKESTPPREKQFGVTVCNANLLKVSFSLKDRKGRPQMQQDWTLLSLTILIFEKTCDATRLNTAPRRGKQNTSTIAWLLPKNIRLSYLTQGLQHILYQNTIR